MPTHANEKLVTGRHNLACSMIFKATSKTGNLGSCFVCMDLSSSERLAMQNLQNSNAAETRIIPEVVDGGLRKGYFWNVLTVCAPDRTSSKHGT